MLFCLYSEKQRHGVRHCLRLNADDDAPKPREEEKIRQIQDFLVSKARLQILLRFTFIYPLAALSDAPGGDFQGHAIVWYSQDFQF